MIDETVVKLIECKCKIEEVERNLNSTANMLAACEQEIKENIKQQETLLKHKVYYKKAVDLIYERSIKELKEVLNQALAFIFEEKELTVDVELSDKRGKSLTIVVYYKGHKVNLKRGMGMGVKCVISAILHIYYLQCKNSKVLLLDEAYSNISKEYIENFFNFICSLCKRLQFKVILITHDERFVGYADKVYRISDGLVTVEEGNNAKN